jgi:large subunit ribosomal protein L10
MSKYVKNLITDQIRQQLSGVQDALLVNVIGLSANSNYRLRTELCRKNIRLEVVKNSLAARATAGTALAPMFEGLAGTAAVCWGAEDIVSLAKEVIRLAKDDQFKAFVPRGGVVDGQRISDREVADVAKWPSRAEQLSLLLGQILSPGANLVSQLGSIGGALASQIEQLGEGGEEEAPPAVAAEAAAPEAAAPEAAAPEAAAPGPEAAPA